MHYSIATDIIFREYLKYYNILFTQAFKVYIVNCAQGGTEIEVKYYIEILF